MDTLLLPIFRLPVAGRISFLFANKGTGLGVGVVTLPLEMVDA